MGHSINLTRNRRQFFLWVGNGVKQLQSARFWSLPTTVLVHRWWWICGLVRYNMMSVTYHMVPEQSEGPFMSIWYPIILWWRTCAQLLILAFSGVDVRDFHWQNLSIPMPFCCRYLNTVRYLITHLKSAKWWNVAVVPTAESGGVRWFTHKIGTWGWSIEKTCKRSLINDLTILSYDSTSFLSIIVALHLLLSLLQVSTRQ